MRSHGVWCVLLGLALSSPAFGQDEDKRPGNFLLSGDWCWVRSSEASSTRPIRTIGIRLPERTRRGL